MSGWREDAFAWAESKRDGPGAMPPATLGETVGAYARQFGMKTVVGSLQPLDDAYGELEHQVRAETGLEPAEFTDDWNGHGSPPFSVEDRAAIIGEHLGKLDKGAREAIAPLVDIGMNAAAAAQKQSAEDSAIVARSYGAAGHAIGWTVGMTRAMIDPINLITGLAAGGSPAATPFVKLLVREFVANAAQAAITEPLIAGERERLGLPNDPYLQTVLTGGAFGVGFAGVLKLGAVGIPALLRGGAAVGRRLMGAGIEPPVHPAAQEAMADLVERNEVLGAQAHPPTPAARARQPARIDRAGEALEGHGVRAEDPVAGGGADPTPALARDLERQAAAGPEGGAPTAPPVLGPHQVEIGGKRYGVTYKLRDLKDLVVSHFMDGRPNPGYPAEAQPRNLATPASKGLVNEAAAHYRVNEALDQSESAAIGPPVVTPKLITMVGNRRLQMLARVYDRHPENAAAYRAGLAARGYDATGMEFPVLVRELREDLTPDEMRFVGREGNVSPVGKMSAGEQAFSDATLLDDALLALHRGGSATSLANVPFVRAFVDRLVATTEREAFISKDNVVSVEGVRRIEAALVAKAYEAPDIVAGLFEVTDPSSRAILGALADNAALAARVKSEIAAGRIDASLDPSPPLVDAFRLVERARKSGQKVDLLAAQVDLELGAVSPATLDALDYYFRDPPKSKAAKEAGVAYRVAAGRVAIAPQIDRAMNTALSKADAAGDLLGFKPDAGFALREGGTAEMPPGDLTAGPDLAAPAAEGAARLPTDLRAAVRLPDGTIKIGAPFDEHDALFPGIPEADMEKINVRDIGFADATTGEFLSEAEAVKRLPDFGLDFADVRKAGATIEEELRLAGAPLVDEMMEARRGGMASEELVRAQRAKVAAAEPAPVLELEAALPDFGETLRRTGPGSVNELFSSGASDAEIAAHPDVAVAIKTFETIKARTGPGSARDLIARKASEAELEAHPDVKTLNAIATSLPDTMEWGKPPPAGFDETRVYNFAGERVVGFSAAVAKGVEKADTYAGPGGPLNERKATVVIGPPAVGKSSFAEIEAGRMRAAIVDADDMKPAIPGYLGGLGAGAVHNESAHLVWGKGGLNDQLIARGANLVIPRIGNGEQTIRQMIADLEKEGYTVSLLNVAVKPDEAYRRMITRALDTGRIIQSEFFRGIGDKPTATYHILRDEKGLLHETASVDNNGARGSPVRFLDGADTELGKTLSGRGGGDQLLHERGDSGARGAPAAVPGPGGAAEGVRPPGGGAQAAGGSLPPGAPGAGAGEVTPKPIGDPQLAAEADSVIADVGENFLIKLAEPGSDEVRTLSIAEARAEAAEVDAAANELLACIAGAAGVTAAAGAAAGGAAL